MKNTNNQSILSICCRIFVIVKHLWSINWYSWKSLAKFSITDFSRLISIDFSVSFFLLSSLDFSISKNISNKNVSWKTPNGNFVQGFRNRPDIFAFFSLTLSLRAFTSFLNLSSFFPDSNFSRPKFATSSKMSFLNLLLVSSERSRAVSLSSMQTFWIKSLISNMFLLDFK